MKFNPKIRAVIFDLGDTLMVPIGPWGNVFLKAGTSLQNYLYENSIVPNDLDFKSLFLENLNNYYQLREKTLRETTTAALLRELLSGICHKPVEDWQIAEAMNAFYKVTRENWRLDSKTYSILAKIRDDGLTIGMISNAADQSDVFALLDGFGIRSTFSFIITSAGNGYRKPHPTIFSSISDHLDYSPTEILMVGDRLDTDILGASNYGLRTVWLNRKGKQNTISTLTPDVETHELVSILDFL